MAKLTLRNAIMVTYNLAAFGNHRKTTQAASTVADVYNTNEDAVRVYYSLFGDTKEFKDVRGALNALRRFIDAYTSPWLHRGVRVLSVEVLAEFRKNLQRLELDLATAVQKMINNFEGLRQEAQERLGDLYDESKYPDKEKLQNAFKLSMHYLPMPVASATTLMGLSDEQVEEFKVSFKRDSAEAYNNAHRETWMSAKNQIEKLINTLTDNKRAMRRDVLDKLCDRLSEISRLSLVNDPEFDVLVTCIQEVLSKVDPAGIKKDDAERHALLGRLKSLVELIDESRIISEKDIIDLSSTNDTVAEEAPKAA